MSLTSYALADGVATITMDDGKVNALNVDMLGAVAADLDRAAADEAIVVLTSARKVLSAGFDLRTPLEDWPAMLEAGARVAERLLSFPRPTVVASPGSAVAMGAFLLLSADVRIGAAGEHKIGLNEVAIGLTLPFFGIALARHRLPAAWFDRCTVTGELLDPATAREAGFLDHVVDDVPGAVAAATAALAQLDAKAHASTKLRVRERALAELRDGIAAIGDPDREI